VIDLERLHRLVDGLVQENYDAKSHGGNRLVGRDTLRDELRRRWLAMEPDIERACREVVADA
jgi:hypothetical protein